MASLPQKVSESFKRVNPQIYQKEVMKTENDEGHNRRDSGSRAHTSVSSAVNSGGAIPTNNTRQFTIHADPVPAPRMTRSDKWKVGTKRRPRVQRYFDFRDVLRATIGDVPIVPDELRAIFLFPMPDSWSKKRRQEMHGKPHRQRPDGDNCMKAIQDAIFLEDGGVWKGSFEKRWAVHGRVEIEMRWRTSGE